jgi:hypothetical protein
VVKRTKALRLMLVVCKLEKLMMQEMSVIKGIRILAAPKRTADVFSDTQTANLIRRYPVKAIKGSCLLS